MGEMVERVDEQDRTVGVVDRGEAIRRRWLHRVATTVCRDPDGRILVHRRPDHVSRFPGQYNWLVGGTVGAGETYPAAASRELAEELGVHAPTRFLFKYLRRGVISPYWLGLHEGQLEAQGALQTPPQGPGSADEKELALDRRVGTATGGMPEGVFRDDPLPMQPWGRSGLTRERSSTRWHDGPPSAGRGCAGSTTA
ncbi:NUDIX domain-containing protein [Streptomyces mirabilis]